MIQGMQNSGVKALSGLRQELFPEHLLLGGRLSREKGVLQATMKGWFGRKSVAAPPEQSADGTSALEVGMPSHRPRLMLFKA